MSGFLAGYPFAAAPAPAQGQSSTGSPFNSSSTDAHFLDTAGNAGGSGSGGGGGAGGNMNAWNVGSNPAFVNTQQHQHQSLLQHQQHQQHQQQPQQHQQPAQHAARAPSVGRRSFSTDPDSNAFLSILAGMPSSTADPTAHTMWMEAVKYKTKSLELAIVEARRKEREAELELAKLKAAVDRRVSFRNNDTTAPMSQANAGAGASTSTSGVVGQGHAGRAPSPASNTHASMGMPMGQGGLGLTVPEQSGYTAPSPGRHSFSTATYPYLHTRPMLGPAQTPRSMAQASLPDVSAPMSLGNSNPLGAQGLGQGAEQAITPFDLEAMLQASNIDNMFSWLPDLGGPSTELDLPTQAQNNGIDPNALRLAPNPTSTLDFESALDTSEPLESVKEEPLYDPSPSKRRPSSGAESAGAASDLPTTKRSRKGVEKKIVVEQNVSCSQCHAPLARTMVRGLKSQLPDPIVPSFKCLACAPVEQPTTIPDPNISGSSIGTVDSRKRLRSGMELDDDESNAEERRQFCDVCQRVIGSGQIRGGKQKEHMGFMAEVVCAPCDARYQRCTDCGGGGGPRMGIGKWRLKQVFQPGRKTCSLSHSRLGDRPREIGVHVTPSDFTPEQLNEVLSRCKALWQEKNLARLAVPEMMEIDLPANLINPLKSYADIENIIVQNWPSREAMIKADDADAARFRRLLGLTWAHTRPRRNVRTVDLEGEGYAKTAEADEYEDTSTVLDNVKRTNVVIPAGCELIGMWGGEWDMQHGSILISTFIPFEGTDGEDSTALSVGEIVTKVHTLQQTMNDAISAGASSETAVPPCEHLWVVSGSSVPLVRERMADILTRKRSFVHLEEYLTRHPDFANAVRDRPYGLHPTAEQMQAHHYHLPFSAAGAHAADPAGAASGGAGGAQRPLILARWLGKDFNPDKIREIKQMEFGGKARMKKRAKK